MNSPGWKEMVFRLIFPPLPTLIKFWLQPIVSTSQKLYRTSYPMILTVLSNLSISRGSTKNC